MYLEKIKTLPQGTPVFEVESGYKDCKIPGTYQAYPFGERMICPGCALSCRLPGYMRRGDPIIVRKRSIPEKERR